MFCCCCCFCLIVENKYTAELDCIAAAVAAAITTNY